jgi:hypothetical protein
MDNYKFIPSESALKQIEKNEVTFLGELEFNKASVYLDNKRNVYIIVPNDTYCQSIEISQERFLIECIIKREFPYSNLDFQAHNNKIINCKNTFFEYRSKFENINNSFSWIFNEPKTEFLDATSGNKIDFDTSHIHNIELWAREKKSLSKEEIEFLICAIHNRIYSTMFCVFEEYGDLNPGYYLGLISKDLTRYYDIDEFILDNFKPEEMSLDLVIKSINSRCISAMFKHKVTFFRVTH